MPEYNIVAVSRTPNATGGGWPTLTDIAGLTYKGKLAWAHELWGDGGWCVFSIDPVELSDTIKQRFRNIYEYPTEIKVYRDSTLVFEGPIVSVQVQGETVTINARGVLYYLRYMGIVSDLEYSSVDQYTIGKGLVNQWQNQTYGNFGIDTSGISTSGTTKTKSYYRSQGATVKSRLQQLAEANDGFDYYVTLDGNRDLVFEAERGSDLSSSIFLDSRVIASPQIAMSVAAGAVANQVVAVGVSLADEVVYGTSEDATNIAKFGRAYYANSFDGVTQQTTIDEHGDALLDGMNSQIFTAGQLAAYPVEGLDVLDFDVGDKITWYYDAGLGAQQEARDVIMKEVGVDKNGVEDMKVEFL